MERNNFDYQYYLATLRTAKAAGLDMVPKNGLVSVLAIVYFEDCNEQITHNYKLLAEVAFAQEQFHFLGGEQPQIWIANELKDRINRIREYKKLHGNRGYPEWAYQLMKSRYSIELRG